MDHDYCAKQGLIYGSHGFVYVYSLWYFSSYDVCFFMGFFLSFCLTFIIRKPAHLVNASDWTRILEPADLYIAGKDPLRNVPQRLEKEHLFSATVSRCVDK